MPQPSIETLTTSSRSEIELLICCARTCIDSAGTERIRAVLQEDINWAYLINTATQHGVLPLLYQSLCTTCPEAVPSAVMNQLRGHFQANALRNLLLTGELLKLLKLFEMHGISAIPYKGPILAITAYHDLALRQFGDLDILVHARDVLKAKELLISHGYRSRGQCTSAQEAASLQWQHHFKFVRNDGRVLVELHWRVVERRFSPSLDPEYLWDRIHPVPLSGTMVPSLLAEDLLLLLCVHGSKHNHHWRRLGWICDVAELIRVHPGLGWERVIGQAHELGCERRLLLGLGLAHHLLGTTLPKVVRLKMQADPVVELLAVQVCEWLFSAVDDRRGVAEEFRFGLKVMERGQDRVRFCIHSAMNATVIRWALRSPIGLLSSPYHLLDRTQNRNVWIWPLPLFALLSFLYHLMLPIRRFAKYGLKRFAD